MNTSLTELQRELLLMMRQLHEIFEEHDIKYYMIGGTLLGSIRHKGFIPWDDDIDLGILRSDYEKLIQIKDTISASNIQLIIPFEEKDYPYPFIKVINKDTTLIEDNINNYISGIYIDIFPIDGVPNNQFARKLHLTKIKYYYMLFTASQLNTKNKNIFKKCICNISCLIGKKFWLMRLDTTLKKYDISKSNYVGNLLGIYGEKEIVPKKIFDSRKILEFENQKFWGLNFSEEYLTSVYGDFMKIPPIEKQKSHHKNRYLNLSMPYEEYKNRISKNNKL